MKPFFVAFAILSIALAWQCVNTSETDFVEDESGLENQDASKRHIQRGQTKWSLKNGCYHCSKYRRCSAGFYCDVQERVCKPKQAKCSPRNRKGCKRGYQCELSGVCKLRPGFCTKTSHCQSDECCLRRYGHRKPGICKRLPAAEESCDPKGKKTCPCVDGYICKRRGYRRKNGRCVAKPTPPPTEEPGSGDIEL